MKRAVLGATGSGKSRLLYRLLEGEIPHKDFQDIQGKKLLGLTQEEQSRYLDAERKRDESDILEYQDKGTLLRDFLGEIPEGALKDLLHEFQLTALLDQGMRFLSTGERRKAFLLRLFLSQPDCIILENPLAGLDHSTAEELKEWLNRNNLPTLLILSRIEDLPCQFETLYHLQDETMTGPYAIDSLPPLQNRGIAQWSRPLPPAPEDLELYQSGTELIRLKDVNLAYYGKPVLHNINWTVRQGEFWQLSGPNGSGKSSLISLINGDNPRAYGQDIRLFGITRGSGESIWEIRKHLGQLSPSLQQDYRLRVSIGDVLFSGFFDSIGVYRQIKGFQQYLAEQWLERSGMAYPMSHSFNALSQGEQRLILLMRALIKHPPLLLLDEPLLALDAEAAHSMAELINIAAEESQSTLILVSHRPEPLLKASHHLQLLPGENGSSGNISKI